MKWWDKGSELRITERLSLRVYFLFAVIHPTFNHAPWKESTIKRSVDDLELFDDQHQKSARIIFFRNCRSLFCERESSRYWHQLTGKTTTRTTSIYSDKRISEKKKPWKTRNLINIESFSWNKNLNAQKKLAKENESCQNYRLQVVVNHYACNRSASWPLNLRQATKIKINIVRV